MGGPAKNLTCPRPPRFAGTGMRWITDEPEHAPSRQRKLSEGRPRRAPWRGAYRAVQDSLWRVRRADGVDGADRGGVGGGLWRIQPDRGAGDCRDQGDAGGAVF